MKVCPYCAEKIQSDAIVCRYCGRDLPAVESKLDLGQKKSRQSQALRIFIWSFSTLVFLCIAILLINNFLVTKKSPNFSLASWSPDGRKIAFLHENSIYVMNANGSNPTRLTENDFYSEWSYVTPHEALSWSPDGKHIAYSCNKDICLITIDGGSKIKLTNDPAITEQSPVWSPDGMMIAYITYRDAGVNSQDHRWTVSVMNIDGSNASDAYFTVDADPSPFA